MNTHRFDKFTQHLSHFLWSVQKHMDSPSSDTDKRQSLKQDFDLLGKGFNWFLNENTKGDMPAFQLTTTKGESEMVHTDLELLDHKWSALKRVVTAHTKLESSAEDQIKAIDSGLGELRKTLIEALGLGEPAKPENQTSTEKTKSEADSGRSSWDTIRPRGNPSGINVKGRTLKSSEDAWSAITAEVPNRIAIDNDATVKTEHASSWDRIKTRNVSGLEVGR